MRSWLVILSLLICSGSCYARAVPVLVQVLTEDYPPFNMPLPQQQVGGLSTELVRELFRRARLPYLIEVQPWIRAFNSALLQNNTCVYSTTRSENREHQFKWVGPLVNNPWVLYAGPHSPKGITNLEQVRPYRIGDYIGDAPGQYLVARGFDVEWVSEDTLSARKLALGRVDFWATSKYVGHYRIKQLNLAQLHPILEFNDTLVFMACNVGMSDETIQQLNKILLQMQHDGFSDKIRKRYLSNR